ncbi:MAG: hypothetical protein IKW60_02010 [Clostridia bacterium]|nr:hypothetical protein [Clostridia bacterium]
MQIPKLSLPPLMSSYKKDISAISCIFLCMLCVYAIVWSYTGFWPWTGNIYNSFSLQSARWLQGHLDLGQDYPWLELAIYHGRYFVSFPPFPSYVMLPFSLFFGANTPDGWIALCISFLGAFYTYRLFRHFDRSEESATFWTLFIMVGSNLLYITVNGWVWFLAQNLCFALSVMALYYALCAKGGLSLAFWACSVGCRPMNALYAPVLLILLYKKIKEQHPDLTFKEILLPRLHWAIAPCIIAASYMLLNYLRFDSVLEFGHNYLPEFTRVETGQFHLDYMKNNLPSLFRLPTVSDNRTLQFPSWDGMAFYLATPIFVSYFIEAIVAICKRKKGHLLLSVLIPCTVVVHFLLLTAHKTMGGHHFGNRYTLDALPYILVAMLLLMNDNEETEKFHYPLAMLGIALNIVGTISSYNLTI